MTYTQGVVLGLVQGLTEFLPVSSSAHLFIVPTLMGWHYEGVAFDVALHVGTLVALLIAFGHVWWQLARDAVSRERTRLRPAGTTTGRRGGRPHGPAPARIPPTSSP